MNEEIAVLDPADTAGASAVLVAAVRKLSPKSGDVLTLKFPAAASVKFMQNMAEALVAVLRGDGIHCSIVLLPEGCELEMGERGKQEESK